MVSKGATTVWELSNGDIADAGMNSHNIVMLIGNLNIWLHEYLGGIRHDPDVPGSKKIITKSEVVGDLTWVKESYDSIRDPPMRMLFMPTSIQVYFLPANTSLTASRKP